MTHITDAIRAKVPSFKYAPEADLRAAVVAVQEGIRPGFQARLSVLSSTWTEMETGAQDAWDDAVSMIDALVREQG